MPREPSRTCGEHGLALVIVLWIVAVLSVIAASVLQIGRTDLRLAQNITEATAADLLSDGAIETAIHGLMGARADADVWSADGTVYAWRDGRATYIARATSEHGRVDLNFAQVELLYELAIVLGVEEQRARQVAASIVDFRDADAEADSDGAEDGEYLAGGSVVGAKDAPFQSPEELLGVLGVDVVLYRRLEPFVTAYSGRQQPDTDAALPAVLLALHGGPLAGPAGASVDPDLLDDLDGTPRIVLPGSGAEKKHRDLYRIEAETRLSDGRQLLRYAIIEFIPGHVRPYRTLMRKRSAYALTGDG